jgi:tetratricopeptide (TPR) repeat protein
LTQAIQIEPEYIESYVDRSTTYGLRKAPGDLELSLADALKAVEISPDSAEAHVALAWSYLWLDKRTEALLNAYRAVELNSQLSAAYNVRASILFENGEYDASVIDYTKAMALEPASANIPMNRGVAYLKSKRFNEALTDFNYSLEIRPGYDQALLKRAEVYALMGENKLSTTDLNTVIQTSTNPDLVREARVMLTKINHQTN